MEGLIEKLDKRRFNGGARKGAGSKLGAKYRKTVMREAAAAYLTRRIEEEMEGLVTALVAKGKRGDIPAIKEAFERGLGRVKDTHEHQVTLETVLVRFLDERNSNPK